jgi:hypothetical protein
MLCTGIKYAENTVVQQQIKFNSCIILYEAVLYTSKLNVS